MADRQIQTSHGISVGDTVTVDESAIALIERINGTEYAARYRGEATVAAIWTGGGEWVSVYLAWPDRRYTPPRHPTQLRKVNRG